MSSKHVPLIISPAELSPLLTDPDFDLVLLDATYLHLPDPPHRDPLQKFRQRRLPKARFWSLKDVSEPHELGFKLMLPSSERFASAAGQHGIDRETQVIVYDTEGAFSAPRTVFTFLAFGHTRVSLLNGGLPAALDAGLELEIGSPTTYEPVEYPVVPLLPGFITSFKDVQSISSLQIADRIIVDARNRSNFDQGHIPQSVSLPWRELLISIPRVKKDHLLEGEGNIFYVLPTAEQVGHHLETVLGKVRAAEVSQSKLNIVNSCGGGLSAAILWLSLKQSGIHSGLYDESWSGYTQRPEAAIAKTYTDD